MNVSRLTIKLAVSLTPLLLAGCVSSSAPPPIVSGDTYCARSRVIPTTAAQKTIIAANIRDFRSLVDDLNAHNDTYEANCRRAK
jgi:outer membrane murein-binding lipoprotein Lpp